MIAAPDELITALADAHEAEDAFRAAVRQAKQYLGTEDQDRAMRVVRICQRERDRANERVVEVRQFTIAWGCDEVSPGCARCYARTLALRYGHRVWGEQPRRTFGEAHWRYDGGWSFARTDTWRLVATVKALRAILCRAGWNDAGIDLLLPGFAAAQEER